MMLKRLILGANGLFALANGAFMLAASESWFTEIAAYTGPYNVHLVQDVGAAFIVSGLSLLACLWRPSLWPAAMTGAGFLCVHGLIHLVDILTGHVHHPSSDVLVLTIPALLALWAAWPRNPKVEGNSYV
ncbi:MAG: hypothetical protein AAF563_00515 [Pseudomonadota bacterium]